MGPWTVIHSHYLLLNLAGYRAFSVLPTLIDMVNHKSINLFLVWVFFEEGSWNNCKKCIWANQKESSPVCSCLIQNSKHKVFERNIKSADKDILGFSCNISPTFNSTHFDTDLFSFSMGEINIKNCQCERYYLKFLFWWYLPQNSFFDTTPVSRRAM